MLPRNIANTVCLTGLMLLNTSPSWAEGGQVSAVTSTPYKTVAPNSGPETKTIQDSNYWALNLSAPFLEPTCPLMDPLTLFVLRQKLTLQGYQTIIEAQLGNDTVNTDHLRKARIETYIPVIDTDSFQYMLGTKYKQVDLVAEDQETFGKTVQVLWLFNAVKYVINDPSLASL